MLVVVSPAKKLNMKPIEAPILSRPMFSDEARELAKIAAKLSQLDLKKLMGISDTLAKLNKERFMNFGYQNRKAAVLAFAGDTYQGLEARSLEKDEINWAQKHLRILSGLYGILRPMDEIEPYRLEMSSRLATKRGKSLYEYWGEELANALNKQGHETKSEVLVNCASKEYFSAVDLNSLKLPVITPIFMEKTDKGPKIISFYAKKARGAMARFIITRKLVYAEQITEFDSGGYLYQAELSSPDRPLFLRG